MAKPRTAEEERIHALLTEDNFADLSPADWRLVLQSFAREEIEEAASYGRDNPALPSWIGQFPDLGALYIFGKNAFREGPVVSASIFLQDELPTKARANLAEGLNLWVRECLDLFAAGSADAANMLDAALRFEGMFEGIISGSLAEEIVLGRALPMELRVWVAQHLVGRSFPLSVSNNCWESLHEQVPQIPGFAGPVMEWLTKQNEPFDALRLPLAFKPDNDDYVLDLVEGLVIALQEVTMCSNWQDMVKDVFAEYPPWAIRLLKDGVIPRMGRGVPMEDFQNLVP